MERKFYEQLHAKIEKKKKKKKTIFNGEIYNSHIK